MGSSAAGPTTRPSRSSMSTRKGKDHSNFRGSHKAIEPLQGMFATAILKLAELPADPNDERVYDLNPLCQKGFDFVFDVGSGIRGVVVRKLRLSSKGKKGDRITLEADAINNPDAVYELIPQRAFRRTGLWQQPNRSPLHHTHDDGDRRHDHDIERAPRHDFTAEV